jgi:hypothetical protein
MSDAISFHDPGSDVCRKLLLSGNGDNQGMDKDLELVVS